jgi:arylsulfatase A-like enzyme
MGDDHGWEETGYNGHPHLKTPVLDEMAAQGLRLDHFYSAHPSCSPTRGSFLTGRHPNRYGTFTPGCSIRPEEITIAHRLSKAGYACGHFGKWHLGPVKASSPTNPGAMGFDHWVSHDNFFELNPQLSRNGGPPELYKGESSAIVIDETIKFIQQAQEEKKPFLAVVWFGSPHEPYSGLPEDLALYDDLPEEYQEKTVRLTSNETGTQIRRPLREVLRERFAEITAMDRAIGTLRDFLKDEDLRKNTLLWYCGDNGIPRSGLAESQFRGLKGTLYEGGTRVPGIIEWPAKITKPRSSDVNTVTSDMLPTICSILDIPLPDRELDGIDLSPLLDGTMQERPQPICFWEYNMRREASLNLEPYIDPDLQKGTTPLVKLLGGIPTRNFRNYRHPGITDGDYSGTRTIVDNRYKLMLRSTDDGTERQLFDLKNDPAETDNVLEARPKVAKQLEQELREWQESVLNSLTGREYR